MGRKDGAYLRLVVKQPRPSNLLLITATQSVSPFPRDIPATLAFDDSLHLNDGKDIEEVVVRDSTCGMGKKRILFSAKNISRTFFHGLLRVRIYDLVSQGTQREVGSLGNENKLRSRGFPDYSTVYWPEAAKDSE